MKPAKGYSLLELLVVILIVGIISGITIPVYSSYMERAQMAKVTVHFEESIRNTKHQFMKNQVNISAGLPSSLPTTSEGWITTFNQMDIKAPKGGPAFVANASGDNHTGAVGVVVDSQTGSVIITRPAYLELVKIQAEIDSSKVVYR